MISVACGVHAPCSSAAGVHLDAPSAIRDRRAMGDSRPLDSSVMWPRARALIERIVSAADRDALVEDCLDLLLDAIGADRGIVLLSDAGGTNVALHARGRGRALGD